MKKLSFLLATFALLLLVGAGCTDAPQAKDATADESAEATVEVEDVQEEQGEQEVEEGEETKEVTEEEVVEATTTEGMTLSVEALENQTLMLKWEVSDELKEKATGYRLLLDDEPNPQFGGGGYWYDRGPAHFEKEWTELPLGTQYVKACVLEGTECIANSNEVEVEVK